MEEEYQLSLVKEIHQYLEERTGLVWRPPDLAFPGSGSDKVRFHLNQDGNYHCTMVATFDKTKYPALPPGT